jgi:hypothetical protein
MSMLVEGPAQDSRGRGRGSKRARRRLRWWTAGPIALSLLAAVSTGPTTAAVVDVPDHVVIFVIDLSGSMNREFDGDQTRLDVAKDAFAEAFRDAKPEALVGLRVYGDELESKPPSQRKQNCVEDTRLVVPPGKLDRDKIVKQVKGFKARGDTLIAQALRSADEDVPNDALATIVLFSDGVDECYDADLDGDPGSGPSYGEDPCEVAKEIAGSGIDLRIDRVDTVGFAADSAAEKQLRCIADESGGSYTPIESPEDARNVLPVILAKVASPRKAERLAENTISGTPSQQGAPVLARLDGPAPANGRYGDEIGVNSEKWYLAEDFGPDGGTLTATVFGLPAREGIHLGISAYLSETDQTFFSGQERENAGIPLRSTASVRCPGCSVSGGPHDLYWIVSLSSDDSQLAGSYYMEILTEGPGFGGVDTPCEKPQACWYEAAIEAGTTQVEGLENRLQALLDNGGIDPDDLADIDDKRAAVETAQNDAQAAVELRDSLMAQDMGSGQGATALAGPLLLVVLGLAAGAGGLLVTRQRSAQTADGPSSQPGPAAPETPGKAAATPRPEEPSPATSAVADPEAQAAPVTPVAREPGPADEHDVMDDTGPAPEEPEGRAEDAADSELPEAGWYADPDEDGVLRWWDGTDWTRHTTADPGEVGS